MTTLHTFAPEWAGQTVAVLASGPSMSAAVASSLREHKTIAVNHTHSLAPWADMLVALDGNWPPEWRAFKGLRVTGVADDTLDALYAGPMYETIALGPNHTVEIRNSGLASVRIAAAMGAARIILAGFDHPARGGHWYDDEIDAGQYIGLAEGLAAITADLAARGIVIDRLAPLPTAKRARRV